jgi:hypothetical protein
VPKPSNEIDHLDNEYKGQNGALEGMSKPDGFGDRTSISGKSRFAGREPASATEGLNQ